jgi:hypothetical protein
MRGTVVFKSTILSCLIIPIAHFLSVVPAEAASFTVPSKKAGTITAAMAEAKKGDTVWVAKGVYKEAVSVGPGVALVAKTPLEATIEGMGRENAVTLSNHSSVVGFTVTGATIGVYSSGVGNSVAKCLIHANEQTGIMCVGHLPRIEDNIVAFNGGSGIQGWDVRSTIAAINHNTIVYNANHGLSIGGNSDILIENNIIAFNEKVGLKTEPPVKVELSHNSFFGNTELTPLLPESNFAFDPEFKAPKQLDFSLSSGSKCRDRGSDNENLGSRIIDRKK